MRKVVIQKAGSYKELRVEEHPDPTPREGEVLVRVVAAGINYADIVVRMGLYSSAKKYVGWPITPGFEATGVITAVGKGVKRWKAGDAVLAVTRFGGYTSHLVVPEHQVFPVPKGFSMSEAAGFPAVFLTAYYGLIRLADVRPGHRVLVHSAAGGVGSSLLQLGRLNGAVMVGVVGKTHKVEVAQSLGADVVIDKSKTALWAEAKKPPRMVTRSSLTPMGSAHWGIVTNTSVPPAASWCTVLPVCCRKKEGGPIGSSWPGIGCEPLASTRWK